MIRRIWRCAGLNSDERAEGQRRGNGSGCRSGRTAAVSIPVYPISRASYPWGQLLNEVSQETSFFDIGKRLER